MSDTPRVIRLEETEREVHLFGSVAVCWNLTEEEKIVTGTIQDEHGQSYPAAVTVKSLVREGKPYIDFLDVREHDGKLYEDDDSPVEGGFNLVFAKAIARELLLAITYLEKIEGKE